MTVSARLPCVRRSDVARPEPHPAVFRAQEGHPFPDLQLNLNIPAFEEVQILPKAANW